MIIYNLAQSERICKSGLTNGHGAVMICHKIEARGSSVRSCMKAAFAAAERGHRRSGEAQLRVSSLGRRIRSAGLSREWSAIEYNDLFPRPARSGKACAVDAKPRLRFFRVSV